MLTREGRKLIRWNGICPDKLARGEKWTESDQFRPITGKLPGGEVHCEFGWVHCELCGRKWLDSVVWSQEPRMLPLQTWSSGCATNPH